MWPAHPVVPLNEEKVSYQDVWESQPQRQYERDTEDDIISQTEPDFKEDEKQQELFSRPRSR